MVTKAKIRIHQMAKASEDETESRLHGSSQKRTFVADIPSAGNKEL